MLPASNDKLNGALEAIKPEHKEINDAIWRLLRMRVDVRKHADLIEFVESYGLKVETMFTLYEVHNPKTSRYLSLIYDGSDVTGGLYRLRNYIRNANRGKRVPLLDTDGNPFVKSGSNGEFAYTIDYSHVDLYGYLITKLKFNPMTIDHGAHIRKDYKRIKDKLAKDERTKVELFNKHPELKDSKGSGIDNEINYDRHQLRTMYTDEVTRLNAKNHKAAPYTKVEEARRPAVADAQLENILQVYIKNPLINHFITRLSHDDYAVIPEGYVIEVTNSYTNLTNIDHNRTTGRGVINYYLYKIPSRNTEPKIFNRNISISYTVLMNGIIRLFIESTNVDPRLRQRHGVTKQKSFDIKVGDALPISLVSLLLTGSALDNIDLNKYKYGRFNYGVNGPNNEFKMRKYKDPEELRELKKEYDGLIEEDYDDTDYEVRNVLDRIDDIKLKLEEKPHQQIYKDYYNKFNANNHKAAPYNRKVEESIKIPRSVLAEKDNANKLINSVLVSGNLRDVVEIKQQLSNFKYALNPYGMNLYIGRYDQTSFTVGIQSTVALPTDDESHPVDRSITFTPDGNKVAVTLSVETDYVVTSQRTKTYTISDTGIPVDFVAFLMSDSYIIPANNDNNNSVKKYKALKKLAQGEYKKLQKAGGSVYYEEGSDGFMYQVDEEHVDQLNKNRIDFYNKEVERLRANKHVAAPYNKEVTESSKIKNNVEMNNAIRQYFTMRRLPYKNKVDIIEKIQNALNSYDILMTVGKNAAIHAFKSGLEYPITKYIMLDTITKDDADTNVIMQTRNTKTNTSTVIRETKLPLLSDIDFFAFLTSIPHNDNMDTSDYAKTAYDITYAKKQDDHGMVLKLYNDHANKYNARNHKAAPYTQVEEAVAAVNEMRLDRDELNRIIRSKIVGKKVTEEDEDLLDEFRLKLKQHNISLNCYTGNNSVVAAKYYEKFGEVSRAVRYHRNRTIGNVHEVQLEITIGGRRVLSRHYYIDTPVDYVEFLSSDIPESYIKNEPMPSAVHKATRQQLDKYIKEQSNSNEQEMIDYYQQLIDSTNERRIINYMNTYKKYNAKSHDAAPYARPAEETLAPELARSEFNRAVAAGLSGKLTASKFERLSREMHELSLKMGHLGMIVADYENLDYTGDTTFDIEILISVFKGTIDSHLSFNIDSRVLNITYSSGNGLYEKRRIGKLSDDRINKIDYYALMFDKLDYYASLPEEEPEWYNPVSREYISAAPKDERNELYAKFAKLHNSKNHVAAPYHDVEEAIIPGLALDDRLNRLLHILLFNINKPSRDVLRTLQERIENEFKTRFNIEIELKPGHNYAEALTRVMTTTGFSTRKITVFGAPGELYTVLLKKGWDTERYDVDYDTVVDFNKLNINFIKFLTHVPAEQAKDNFSSFNLDKIELAQAKDRISRYFKAAEEDPESVDDRRINNAIDRRKRLYYNMYEKHNASNHKAAKYNTAEEALQSLPYDQQLEDELQAFIMDPLNAHSTHFYNSEYSVIEKDYRMMAYVSNYSWSDGTVVFDYAYYPDDIADELKASSYDRVITANYKMYRDNNIVWTVIIKSMNPYRNQAGYKFERTFTLRYGDRLPISLSRALFKKHALPKDAHERDYEDIEGPYKPFKYAKNTLVSELRRLKAKWKYEVENGYEDEAQAILSEIQRVEQMIEENPSQKIYQKYADKFNAKRHTTALYNKTVEEAQEPINIRKDLNKAVGDYLLYADFDDLTDTEEFIFEYFKGTDIEVDEVNFGATRSNTVAVSYKKHPIITNAILRFYGDELWVTYYNGEMILQNTHMIIGDKYEELRKIDFANIINPSKIRREYTGDEKREPNAVKQFKKDAKSFKHRVISADAFKDERVKNIYSEYTQRLNAKKHKAAPYTKLEESADPSMPTRDVNEIKAEINKIIADHLSFDVALNLTKAEIHVANLLRELGLDVGHVDISRYYTSYVVNVYFARNMADAISHAVMFSRDTYKKDQDASKIQTSYRENGRRVRYAVTDLNRSNLYKIDFASAILNADYKDTVGLERTINQNELTKFDEQRRDTGVYKSELYQAAARRLNSKRHVNAIYNKVEEAVVPRLNIDYDATNRAILRVLLDIDTAEDHDILSKLRDALPDKVFSINKSAFTSNSISCMTQGTNSFTEVRGIYVVTMSESINALTLALEVGGSVRSKAEHRVLRYKLDKVKQTLKVPVDLVRFLTASNTGVATQKASFASRYQLLQDKAKAARADAQQYIELHGTEDTPAIQSTVNLANKLNSARVKLYHDAETKLNAKNHAAAVYNKRPIEEALSLQPTTDDGNYDVIRDAINELIFAPSSVLLDTPKSVLDKKLHEIAKLIYANVKIPYYGINCNVFSDILEVSVKINGLWSYVQREMATDTIYAKTNYDRPNGNNITLNVKDRGSIDLIKILFGTKPLPEFRTPDNAMKDTAEQLADLLNFDSTVSSKDVHKVLKHISLKDKDYLAVKKPLYLKYAKQFNSRNHKAALYNKAEEAALADTAKDPELNQLIYDMFIRFQPSTATNSDVTTAYDKKIFNALKNKLNKLNMYVFTNYYSTIAVGLNKSDGSGRDTKQTKSITWLNDHTVVLRTWQDDGTMGMQPIIREAKIDASNLSKVNLAAFLTSFSYVNNSKQTSTLSDFKNAATANSKRDAYASTAYKLNARNHKAAPYTKVEEARRELPRKNGVTVLGLHKQKYTPLTYEETFELLNSIGTGVSYYNNLSKSLKDKLDALGRTIKFAAFKGMIMSETDIYDPVIKETVRHWRKITVDQKEKTVRFISDKYLRGESSLSNRYNTVLEEYSLRDGKLYNIDIIGFLVSPVNTQPNSLDKPIERYKNAKEYTQNLHREKPYYYSEEERIEDLLDTKDREVKLFDEYKKQFNAANHTNAPYNKAEESVAVEENNRLNSRDNG